HAPDRARVALEGEDFLAGDGVPHPHGPILAGRGKAATLGAECQAQNRARVTLEGTEFELAEALEVIPFKATQVAGTLQLVLAEPLLDQTDLAGVPVQARQLHVRRIIALVA